VLEWSGKKMADVLPGSVSSNFDTISSVFVAALLGYSLISNNIQLLLVLLILVAVFYAKPPVEKKKSGFEGEFSM